MDFCIYFSFGFQVFRFLEGFVLNGYSVIMFFEFFVVFDNIKDQGFWIFVIVMGSDFS